MSEFTTKKINDIEIKPVVKSTNKSAKTIRGFDYFESPYGVCNLIARTNSGKTNVIYRALEQLAAPGVNVMIFASTINNDQTFKKMIAMLKRKKCNVAAYDHFIQGGNNLVDNLLHILSNKAEEEIKKEKDRPHPVEQLKESKPHPKHPLAVCQWTNGQFDPPKPAKEKALAKKAEKKKKKKTKIGPSWVLVFDDLSNLMTDKAIARLCTKARHFKARVFVSTHHINNLDLMARNMVDCYLLFGNISFEKILEIQEKIGYHHKGDTKKETLLHKLYMDATKKKYSFLYFDRFQNKFRKNFSDFYQIDD